MNNLPGEKWRLQMQHITDAVLFLASENAGMITGAILPVDAVKRLGRSAPQPPIGTLRLMSRSGRPSGSNSAETRQRIIDAARGEFANRGYDGAAITTIAEQAGLSPGSIYHYYNGKSALYEAVFDATARATWSELGERAAGYPTVVATLDAMIDDARQLAETRTHHSDFLANVPMEARQHPEFAHLLAQRSKYQDEVFGAIAELGLRTNELAGFDLKHATELIRAPMMGWFFERHFRGAEVDHGGEAIKTLFRILAARE